MHGATSMREHYLRCATCGRTYVTEKSREIWDNLSSRIENFARCTETLDLFE